MKIQPISTSPAFKMKYTQRQVDQTKITHITLNNGNRISIRETTHYKLHSLFNKANQWIKSKLVYKNTKTSIISKNNKL